MINKEEILKKIAFFNKKLDAKPNDKKPMKAKIAIYREVEDYKEMLNTCDTYLKLYPQDLQVCTFKAIALYKLGNREDATKIMEFVNSEIDKFVHDDEITKLSTFKDIELINNELKIDNSEIKNNENSDVQNLNANENVQANSQYNINSIDNNQSQINNNNESSQNNSNQQISFEIDAKYQIFKESEILDLLKLNNITITEEIKEIIKNIKRYSIKKTKESCSLSAKKYFDIYEITKISEFLKYSISNYNSVIEFGNPENSTYFIRGEMYFYLGDVNSALQDYKTGTNIINKTKNILDAIYIKNIKQELRGLLLSKGIILDEVIDLDLIKGKKSSKKFDIPSNDKKQIQEVNNNNNDLHFNQDKFFSDQENNQIDMQEIIEIVKKFSHYEDKFKKMQFKISELEMTVKEQGEKILELQSNKSKEYKENQ